MRRTFLALIFVLAAAPAVAHDWPVAKYAPAVWPIETDNSFCSSVLVGGNGIYLTAAHCFKPDQAVTFPTNGAVATLVEWNEPNDLAVIQAVVQGKPLKPAKREPAAGDMVLSLGFGRAATIVTALPSWWIGLVGEAGLAPTLHATGAIGGMSGGPVVNRQGEIVGLVRAVWDVPTQRVTEVVTLKAIQDAVKRYAR